MIFSIKLDQKVIGVGSSNLMLVLNHYSLPRKEESWKKILCLLELIVCPQGQKNVSYKKH
jgi:hypothetical protein